MNNSAIAPFNNPRKYLCTIGQYTLIAEENYHELNFLQLSAVLRVTLHIVRRNQFQIQFKKQMKGKVNAYSVCPRF